MLYHIGAPPVLSLCSCCSPVSRSKDMQCSLCARLHTLLRLPFAVRLSAVCALLLQHHIPAFINQTNTRTLMLTSELIIDCIKWMESGFRTSRLTCSREDDRSKGFTDSLVSSRHRSRQRYSRQSKSEEPTSRCDIFLQPAADKLHMPKYVLLVCAKSKLK